MQCSLSWISREYVKKSYFDKKSIFFIPYLTQADIYLMHAQGADNFAYFKNCRAYETALELMAEGKFRHFGISFHDRAEVLEQILTEYPQIEVVQIQFNYVDYDDPAVESRKCYEVCRKFGKPVIVMEPVKGGNLVNLPESAKKILERLHGGSPASYAIRFAAGFEGIMMVLSGMSDIEQMQDNISYMKDFQPLSDKEMDAIKQVQEIFSSMNLIPCTSCRYCVAGCPKQIAIPDLFAVMTTKQIYHDWNADYYYNVVHTGGGSWFLCRRVWTIMMKFIWDIRITGGICRWQYTLFWRGLTGMARRSILSVPMRAVA